MTTIKKEQKNIETEVYNTLKSIEASFELRLDTCKDSLTTMFEDNEDFDEDDLEQYLDESLETEVIDDIFNEHAPLLAILKSQDLELYNKFLTAVENMIYIDATFRNYGPCELVLLNKLMNFKKHYELPILDMGPEILTEVENNFYIFNVKDTFVELLDLAKLLDDKYQITDSNIHNHLKTIDHILEKELHNFPLLEISSATYKSEQHTI